MSAGAAAARLRAAAARGDTAEALRLLDDGAQLLPDELGRNALHLAASGGHADVVAALLLAGCDVNVTDGAGCSALQHAAAEGHLEVVRQLIQRGADVNHQDSVHGNTALHEASWKGFSRSVAALGRARAQLHVKNGGGFAALHLACQNGHNQSCRELLLAGCSPNLQNNYGDTPLHTSARYGHAGVTRILISACCRVSDQNKNGDTALHIAAAMGRRKLTRILLEAGCDRALKNKQNETALDIASRKQLSEVAALLRAAPGAAKGKDKEKDKGKSKGDPKGERSKGDKKREKTESGTSSKDSGGRRKDKKKHKNEHGPGGVGVGVGGVGGGVGGVAAKGVHFEKRAPGAGPGGGGGGGRHWSPYGCHYFPDPRAFPQPNLDSLPHEPLQRGEQYYLDLAGNIRKGPVGVGYTCYCAPFFRHMEARLDRDKQELKQHIDQAHQRLDQKVSSLERRTQGRLSELTRCVAAERALCEQRHARLAQWLTRGAAGRRSERAPPRHLYDDDADEERRGGVPRARSLELLLDAPDDDRGGWRGELRGGGGYGGGVGGGAGAELQRSCDALLERELALDLHLERPPPLLERGRPPGAPRPQRRVVGGAAVLERSFDVLPGESSSPGPSPAPAAGPGPAPQPRPRSASAAPRAPSGGAGEGDGQGPVRRSVHELVAQLQGAVARRSLRHELPCGVSDGAAWRRGVIAGGRGRPGGEEEASESSEGEDDTPNGGGEGGDGGGHDYENVAWADDDRRLQALPFRTRAAVYSPSPPPGAATAADAAPDLHNDSGYSTRLYGSSKGPSPALSGQLECDGILPHTSHPHSLYSGGGVRTPISRQHEQRSCYDDDTSAPTTVVTASLV